MVEIQQAVRRVRVDDDLADYALALVARTRQHERLSLGVSPRGGMSLYRATQALAALEGRAYAMPDDLKRLAVPVFAHRCVVDSRFASARKKREEAEAILEEIVGSIPIPL